MIPTSRIRLASLLTLLALLAGLRAPAAPAAAQPAGPAAHTIFLPTLLNGPGEGPSLPTSDELIAAALARGELDPDTALVYRVFAAFADPRLPAAYRGAPPEVPGAATWDARERFAALAPERQALLAPFLVPPFHHGSWWQQRYAPRAAPGAGLADAPIDDPTLLDTQWRSVLAPGGKVRVWWQADRPADAEFATAIGGEVATVIWPKLAALMGREPLSDGGAVRDGRGGDNAFDIALVDAASKVEPFDWCSSESPGYMLFSRGVADWQEELAHELMHAFQFSFATRTGCVTTTYRWLSESTAQWAADYVYPQGGYEHASARLFFREPHLPLDTVTDYGRHYGAYLAWLYVDKVMKRPDLIGQLWRAAASWGPVEVVERTIPGGFAALWPKVLLYNANQLPFDIYTRHDGLRGRPQRVDNKIVDITMDGAPQVERLLPVELERLGGSYYHYRFPDERARLVTFYNGLTAQLSRERVDFAGRSFDAYVWEQAARARWEGASLQALIKIGGVWSYEDWTERPYRAFCRDRADQRLEELVLIVGNSRWESGAEPVAELKQPAALVAGDMGCWRYAGATTVVSTQEASQVTAAAREVLFAARPITAYTLPTADPSRARRFLGPLRFTPVGGTVSVSGSLAQVCSEVQTVVGTISGSAPLRTLEQGDPFSYLELTAFSLGGPHHRDYSGTGVSQDSGTISQTCAGGASPYLIGLWLETRRLEPRPAPAGALLWGDFNAGGVRSTWQLRPLRQ